MKRKGLSWCQRDGTLGKRAAGQTLVSSSWEAALQALETAFGKASTPLNLNEVLIGMAAEGMHSWPCSIQAQQLPRSSREQSGCTGVN